MATEERRADAPGGAVEALFGRAVSGNVFQEEKTESMMRAMLRKLKPIFILMASKGTRHCRVQTARLLRYDERRIFYLSDHVPDSLDQFI